MIAIICPTRGRPKQFMRMCESVYKTTTTKIAVHLLVQTDRDEKEYFSGYLGEDKRVLCQKYTVGLPDNKYVPTVYLWNKGYKLCKDSEHNFPRLFMLGADDTVFATPGWDTALIDHYTALKEKAHVYHLQDSRDSDGTPHPIVTREYVDVMGYAFVPIFLHWFVDTWTREIAKANNVFTHLKDYLLIHDKSWERGVKPPDSTHTGIRRLGWLLRDEYVDRVCQPYLTIEKERLRVALCR